MFCFIETVAHYSSMSQVGQQAVLGVAVDPPVHHVNGSIQQTA